MLSDFSGNTKDDKKFEPSTPILKRMLKVLLEDSIGKTRFSQVANVHYTVMMKHLEWLESRKYIRFTFKDGMPVVELTEAGREYANRFLALYD
jgi:predicted transcriptional regulator